MTARVTPRGAGGSNRKLTDAQFEAIAVDRRPAKIIAAAHGISLQYVRDIREGKFIRKPAARPDSTRPLPPRHYRPFRDGTYL